MKKLLILMMIVICASALCAFYPRTYTYDAEKAVNYVTEHAARRSQGLCARYVRMALEAGGCNTWGHPLTADAYNDFMESLDFTRIEKKNYYPKKGDVVVFASVKGHPFGHIAMWNGRQWVSDFRQKGIFVAEAYFKTGNHNYYRMTKQYPRRYFKIKHHITALAVEPMAAVKNIIRKYI